MGRRGGSSRWICCKILAALVILLAVAGALLALGAVGRVAPRRVAGVQAVLCLVGVVAALSAPGIAVMEVGATATIDGFSAIVLAGLLLLGACQAAGPVMLGALALALLAGDAITLLACVGAGLVAAPPWRDGGVAFAAQWGGTAFAAQWRGRAVPVVCLAVALLLLSWHGALPDPRFAAIRALPPGPVAGAVMVFAVVFAAGTLAMAIPTAVGALMGVALLGRLLLDLAGPVTPGWWGVPVLACGVGAAASMARRAAAVQDLAVAVQSVLRGSIGLAAAAMGAALLARGADLGPLAALAVVAGLVVLLATALWGGLVLASVAAILATTGTTSLVRLGGLLRLMPVTSLGLLIGLLSVAAVPLTPGFAAVWLLIQALLGVARLGGIVVLAVAAGALAGVGLTVALLGAAALRCAGIVLLGAPRTARAAAAIEPGPAIRGALAALAAAVFVTGVFPWLLVALVQPATRQLVGLGLDGATVWSLAGTPDAPGYGAPLLGVLLGICVAGAVWAGRSPWTIAPVWRGGLAEDGPARANTHAVRLLPDWRDWNGWRGGLQGRVVVGVLVLALAATLGWAAR